MSEASQCSICGAPVQPEDKSCSSCGAVIVPPSEPPPPLSAHPQVASRSLQNAIALGILLIAAIGITIVLQARGSAKPQSPQEFRAARAELEAEWESTRDAYFAFLAKADVVENEDMDHRRITLKVGSWEKLDSSEQEQLVRWLTLKTSVRLGDGRLAALEILEGDKVVARHDPERGVVIN